MIHPALRGALCAGFLALLVSPCEAHGGRYLGPPDIVPPNPGGSRAPGGSPSPTTPGGPGPSIPGPGPGGVKTPGPAGPSLPGPGPGPAPGPKTGPRGRALEVDFTTWDVWWEFNKDPYIQLKQAIHTGFVQTGGDDFFMGPRSTVPARDSLKPTDDQILQVILPALEQAMATTDSRDIRSSCMVAMAKIGMERAGTRLLDVFRAHLTSHDQEVRETAALAIGIAQLADDEAVTLLTDLALDRPAGRKATARAEVDDRTRSFACYALGLVAHATSNPAVKSRILDALVEILGDESIPSRNLRVSAIQGISLLHPDPSPDSADGDLLARALAALDDYYAKDLGPGEQMLQAHCPTAVARLLPREHPLAQAYRQRFVAELTAAGPAARSSNDIVRSCILALGQLCRAYEDDASPDRAFSDGLLRYYRNGKDQQARYFALLALGQIGGTANRNRLLLEFDRGSKALEKPWAALALGVLEHARQRDGRGPSAADPLVAERLTAALATAKNPDLISALAVSLGLMQHRGAADRLRALLQQKAHQEKLAGYLCIGLALIGDDRAVPQLQDLIVRSVRRPLLMQQAAVALGKLGDKKVADRLLALLDAGEPNLARMAAIASALGFIGDQRTVQPLCDLLLDDDLTPLTRAFAAVALGGVADKEPLPWNAKIAENLNYRAAVETLTNSAAGVLDIL